MTPREPVPIDIEVGVPLGEPSLVDDAILQSKISERVVDLLDDLGLPAAPSVRLTHTANSNPHAGAQPTVAIGGQLCRQEVIPQAAADAGSMGELGNRVAAAVYWNRHLLLTRSLRDELAGQGRGQTAALLPELMRRGLSVKTVEAVGNELDPNLSDESGALQLELAVARRFPRSGTIEAGRGLYQVMTGATGKIGEMLGMMRDGLFYELGIKFPPFRIACNQALADEEFRFRIGAVRGPVTTGLADDEYLINDTPASLSKTTMGVVARPARNPATSLPAAIISGEEAANQCESVGQTAWDRAGYVVLTLARHLRVHADILFTITEAQRTLSRLADAFPLPIVDLLERFSPIYVVRVMRALVKEGVSIRDLRSVMEAMLEVNGELVGVPTGSVIAAPAIARLSRFPVRRPAGISPEDCAEYVRMAMKNYLTHKHARDGEPNVLETTAATEARLRGTPPGNPQQEGPDLVWAIANAMEKAQEWQPIAILTSFDVRRQLRAAIEIEFPHVSVLSREEITDLAAKKTRGSIAW